MAKQHSKVSNYQDVLSQNLKEAEKKADKASSALVKAIRKREHGRSILGLISAYDKACENVESARNAIEINNYKEA